MGQFIDVTYFKFSSSFTKDGILPKEEFKEGLTKHFFFELQMYYFRLTYDLNYNDIVMYSFEEFSYYF